MYQNLKKHHITVTALHVLLAFSVLALVACAEEDDSSSDTGRCGDSVCAAGETKSSCPQDCAKDTCGDKVCGASETATSCPGDCVKDTCGDKVCGASETATSCPVDCVKDTCGDKVCGASETATSCAQDCTTSVTLKNNSSYTINHFYIYECTAPNEGADVLKGTYVYSGYSFPVNGIPGGACYLFHATATNGVWWRSPTGSALENGKAYSWTLGN